MSEVLLSGRRVLREEAQALLALADRLDESFEQAVQKIIECSGRVVVSGMGKSGHVGRKLAATLASTGTPALFLHPAEALHGDLGMAAPGDVALVLSNSGESDELRALLPALKQRVDVLIALTGKPGSTLGRAADIVLDTAIVKEACPHDLAPTTSTTLMLALGDALAVAAMEARGFGREDYARLHPAGALGRRLLLRVSDVMRQGENVAVLPESASIRDVVLAMPRAHQRAALLVDSVGKLAGLITSGDLRRGMERFEADAMNQPAREIATPTPLTIDPDALAIDGLRAFREFPADIAELPVVDGESRPVGMLMLRDLLRAGISLPESEG
jgi:arabinose-5-phosphate isomerase